MDARGQGGVVDVEGVGAGEAVQAVGGEADAALGGDLDERFAAPRGQPDQAAAVRRGAVQGLFDLGDEQGDDGGEAGDEHGVGAGLREGVPYGVALVLTDRPTEEHHTVAAEFARVGADRVKGDLGAEAGAPQRGGELGEEGGAPADEEDAAVGGEVVGVGGVQQPGQFGAVLVAVEAVGADAVVAVAFGVGGGAVGLPEEVPPDDIGPVPFDDGGDRAAGQPFAFGAAIDDVPSAVERWPGLQQEAAHLLGEDGGAEVRGERGDGVEVGEARQQGSAVHLEVQEIAVHLVRAAGQDAAGAHGRYQPEGGVLGGHAPSIPTSGQHHRDSPIRGEKRSAQG